MDLDVLYCMQHYKCAPQGAVKPQEIQQAENEVELAGLNAE